MEDDTETLKPGNAHCDLCAAPLTPGNFVINQRECRVCPKCQAKAISEFPGHNPVSVTLVLGEAQAAYLWYKMTANGRRWRTVQNLVEQLVAEEATNWFEAHGSDEAGVALQLYRKHQGKQNNQIQEGEASPGMPGSTR